MTSPFKASFCTLNVGGLNQVRKRRQLFRWLHNYNFDVIFLQETCSSPNVERIWKSEWGGSIIYSHWTNCSKSIVILFNLKLDVLIGSSEADEKINGRCLPLEACLIILSLHFCFETFTAQMTITVMLCFFQSSVTVSGGRLICKLF